MGIFNDCVCDPIEKNGHHYVQWIGSVFGDCIYSALEKFSYYSGVISILFYFIAFYPQIYENYKRKSTEGLSLTLITIWFFGDVANYIGTVLTEQYPIQKIIGIYFAVMEIIVYVQYFYYKFFYKGPNVITDVEDEDEPTENDPLIIKTDANDTSGKDHRQGKSPQLTYETFSDIQKTPIQPPLDPVEGTDATPKVNASLPSTSSPSRAIDATSPHTNSTHINSTLSGSVGSKHSKKEPAEEIVAPEQAPIEEEKVKEDEPKYETLDEVSQKQQEAEPSDELKPEQVEIIKHDDEKEEDEEEDDDEDMEDSKDSLEDSRYSLDDSSKETSQMSLDTGNGDDDEDEDEGGISRSESSLNKKKKKKGRKGKKGKKGRRPKRGKGLSTVLQTIALFTLFIIQIQAKAIEYQSQRFSVMEDPTDEAPLKICDASPNLSLLQKVFGSLMAWSSGILYFTCRIPQILENKKNRSVEGLSILLFLCTILGNLFYGISIIIRFPPINAKFFAGTLPYFIGSMGTFIFDIIIIYQFNVYKDTGVVYNHIE